jgi:hypothetical protein
MKAQEFLRHLELEHSAIWDRLRDDWSLQEVYAAAQRHRQEHLKELDEVRQLFRILPEPMTHVHTNGIMVGKPGHRAVALGPRDVEI